MKKKILRIFIVSLLVIAAAGLYATDSFLLFDLAYISILVFQLVLDTIGPSGAFGALFSLVPFVIGRYYFYRQKNSSSIPSPEKLSAVTYAQFIYNMFDLAGLSYFEKNPANVRSSDFVELDYRRKLGFEKEIVFER